MTEEKKEQRLQRRYRLALIDQWNDKQMFSLSMPIWVVALLTVLVALLTLLLAAVVVVRTPLRHYLPGYLDVTQRAEIVEMAMRIDSIAAASTQRTIYLQNLTDVLRDRNRAVDEVASFDSSIVHFDDSLREASHRERAFVERYAQQERFGLDAIHEAVSSGVLFLAPVQGELQGGGRIIVQSASTVVAPFDGTVLSVDYLLGEGYKVMMQHNGDYLIALTHISEPIVTVGATVKTGTAIGRVGIQSEGPDRWLGIELWHKGQRIDPKNVMQF